MQDLYNDDTSYSGFTKSSTFRRDKPEGLYVQGVSQENLISIMKISPRIDSDDENTENLKRVRDGDDSEGDDGCGPSKAARLSSSNGEDTEQSDDSWTEEMHRDFVTSIFEIGLRNSSPAVILENMIQKPESITSERVKSKLQKYRNNKEKSKQDFLEEYDAFLQKIKTIDSAGGVPIGNARANALLDFMGSQQLLGGDAAAFLSFATMKDGSQGNAAKEEGPAGKKAPSSRTSALDYLEHLEGTRIPFPELTEAEKSSPLGVSISFVMGIFLSMTQYMSGENANTESIATIEMDAGKPNPAPSPPRGKVLAQMKKSVPLTLSSERQNPGHSETSDSKYDVDDGMSDV